MLIYKYWQTEKPLKLYNDRVAAENRRTCANMFILLGQARDLLHERCL